MSDSYLTEKLAEVRAELNRLHQKEALLIKAVLAEPDLARHLRVNFPATEVAEPDRCSEFSSVGQDRLQSDAAQVFTPPRPRPGWPISRTTPTPDMAQRAVATSHLELVHSAR